MTVDDEVTDVRWRSRPAPAASAPQVSPPADERFPPEGNSEPSSAKAAPKSSWKPEYNENLSKRRKERYANDPEYRKKVKAASRKRYNEQSGGALAETASLIRANVARLADFANSREVFIGRAAVGEGDVLVVTKLDRLARSVAHLSEIVARLEMKGVALRILALNLDTATPTGKLMLNMLGAVAQFEREMMLERQREGIAKAKAENKYKGRAPTARAKADEIKQFAAEGMTRAAIAERLEIGVASVYRVLAK